MDLSHLLNERYNDIVQEVTDGLARTPLKHYGEEPRAMNARRVRKILDLMMLCIRTEDLVPMIDYARTLARERFEHGYPLQEVLTAFNVGEEVLWKFITQELAPSAYPQALGLVSTVLGAGKEALAVEYVELASASHMPSLDLSELFKGTPGD